MALPRPGTSFADFIASQPTYQVGDLRPTEPDLLDSYPSAVRRVDTGIPSTTPLTTTSALWPKQTQLPAIEQLMHVLNILSSVTICEFQDSMYNKLTIRQVSLCNNTYYKIAIAIYLIAEPETAEHILIINTDYAPNIANIDNGSVITTSGILTIY